MHAANIAKQADLATYLNKNRPVFSSPERQPGFKNHVRPRLPAQDLIAGFPLCSERRT
jgi:hypothetical protein